MENQKKQNYGPEGSTPPEGANQDLPSKDATTSKPITPEFMEADPNRPNPEDDRNAGLGDTSQGIGSDRNMGEENRFRSLDRDERHYNDQGPNHRDFDPSVDANN